MSLTSPPRDKSKSLKRFNPKQTRMKLGALKEGVKIAAKIKDWEALEKAVEAIIDEQQAFVAWWDANVTPGRDATLLRGAKPVIATRQERELSAKEATAQTGVTPPQVSKWRKRLVDEDTYREILREGAYMAMWALRDDVRGTQGTGENEWFTPAEFIELARAVLGDIDLDPAGHAEAQAVMRAAKYFSKQDDGLTQEWCGRVFLNPPYAQPLIADFVSKMCAERRANRVTAAIMLTHNYTDTAWFHEAAGLADAICFTRGRVKFHEPDGTICAPTQGQAFFYFGSDLRGFESRFRTIGFVVTRM